MGSSPMSSAKEKGSEKSLPFFVFVFLTFGVSALKFAPGGTYTLKVLLVRRHLSLAL